MYNDYMYYDIRQQQQPQFFPIPGFPGGGGTERLEQEIRRLERQVQRNEREINRLDRRVDRLERRFGLGTFQG